MVIIGNLPSQLKQILLALQLFTLDLMGYSSGVYKAVVSNPTYQDTAKFSVGLSSGSGAITFSSTQPDLLSWRKYFNYWFNTGANSILNISLIDTNGETINKIEIFADKEGVIYNRIVGNSI